MSQKYTKARERTPTDGADGDFRGSPLSLGFYSSEVSPNL